MLNILTASSMPIESFNQELRINLEELRALFPDRELSSESKFQLERHFEGAFNFILPSTALNYSSLNYHLICPLEEEKGLVFSLGVRSNMVSNIPYSVDFFTKEHGKVIYGINGLHAGVQSIFPVVWGVHNTNLKTLNLTVSIQWQK